MAGAIVGDGQRTGQRRGPIRRPNGSADTALGLTQFDVRLCDLAIVQLNGLGQGMVKSSAAAVIGCAERPAPRESQHLVAAGQQPIHTIAAVKLDEIIAGQSAVRAVVDQHRKFPQGVGAGWKPRACTGEIDKSLDRGAAIQSKVDIRKAGVVQFHHRRSAELPFAVIVFGQVRLPASDAGQSQQFVAAVGQWAEVIVAGRIAGPHRRIGHAGGVRQRENDDAGSRRCAVGIGHAAGKIFRPLQMKIDAAYHNRR
ncbi:MAG: hypothetical protein BWY83_00217 [bacterium ADurb.Bin478]|nr:MAG: hypothetical protein BWY83_00217 [bacterium ADurb.Bin478]